MEFMQTQTCRNLARSFAGESQARQRYTQYADQARKEGLAYLARIFEETAANEQIHAQEFLEKLQKYGRQPIENIDLSAGYPYTLGVTMENLLEAAKGENEEAARLSGVCENGARGRLCGRGGALGKYCAHRGDAPRCVSGEL